MAEAPPGIGAAMHRHWPEYAMEAAGLGLFMVSAGLVTTLLEHPGSIVHQTIPDAGLRRLLIGIAMGLTAIALIYSPWGKQSGAHLNPAVTLTFLRLGKVRKIDAAFYILAQFVGGAAGVLVVWGFLGDAFALPPVDFVNTRPGPAGAVAAFLTETAMAFGIMLMVLSLLARERLMPFIGLFAGFVVATYIAVLAPLSGMSINPARSFASALPALLWQHLWIYFTAPVIGMQLAVEALRLAGVSRRVFCAKLNHHPAYRCIHCGYTPDAAPAAVPANSPVETLAAALPGQERR
ncbi:MAG: aquaporin [Rhodospirillales bacterium]